MLLNGNLQGVQHLGIPVSNLEKAKTWYVEKLGFKVAHEPTVPTEAGEIKVAFLDLGGLVLELYQLVGPQLEEVKGRRHGHIDHFAIDVLDLERALADALKRGAVLEEATADGPVALPTFWSQGVRYVFLKGPDGEKVEFNQRLDLPASRRPNNLGGWSHLGIPVTDLERSKAFYTNFGFKPVMNATIPVDGRAIKATMLEHNAFVLEMYQLLDEDLAEIRARTDGHIDHIALDVADVDRAFQELRTAGMPTLEDAPVPLAFWEKGVKYFNVRGPDGEKVEFNQRFR